MKVFVRDPVDIEPRKPLTPKQRAELFLAHDGRCYIDGEKIKGAWDDEHILALSMGGSNDLSNRAPCCKACHKIKTRDDMGRLAKAKRNEARHNGTRRPRKAIQSRGFSKTLSKKFNGEVVSK